jgi:hypothetical protein
MQWTDAMGTVLWQPSSRWPCLCGDKAEHASLTHVYNELVWCVRKRCVALQGINAASMRTLIFSPALKHAQQTMLHLAAPVCSCGRPFRNFLTAAVTVGHHEASFSFIT